MLISNSCGHETMVDKHRLRGIRLPYRTEHAYPTINPGFTWLHLPCRRFTLEPPPCFRVGGLATIHPPFARSMEGVMRRRKRVSGASCGFGSTVGPPGPLNLCLTGFPQSGEAGGVAGMSQGWGESRFHNGLFLVFAILRWNWLHPTAHIDPPTDCNVRL